MTDPLPSLPLTLAPRGEPAVYDITLIGGGPVGLFGAYYAGLRRLKTKIIDSLDQLGGQLTALYPEKYIFDVPGFPKVVAKDLAARLTAQAMQYSPTLVLGQTVRTLRRDDTLDCYALTTDTETHYTKTLVICAGVGAFQAKKLPLPDTDQFEGRGVYYAVTSKAVFAGRRVLVVGGGDSAVDWALNLLDTAQEITLIHRRNQFRAHEESVRKLVDSSVNVLTFWELKSLLTAEGRLTGAWLVQNQTGELKTLPLDAILVQVGFVSNLGPLRNWPVKIVGGGVAVNSHMETSLPGVFAAGDVAAYDGKLKLIATGFGEVATAVNFAKTQVDPKAKLFPGHSSEMALQQPVVTVGTPPTA